MEAEVINTTKQAETTAILKNNKFNIDEQTIGMMVILYKMCHKTFQKSIKPIRSELDNMVGRKRYSRLTSNQVKLIIAHMGEPIIK